MKNTTVVAFLVFLMSGLLNANPVQGQESSPSTDPQAVAADGFEYYRLSKEDLFKRGLQLRENGDDYGAMRMLFLAAQGMPEESLEYFEYMKSRYDFALSDMQPLMFDSQKLLQLAAYDTNRETEYREMAANLMACELLLGKVGGWDEPIEHWEYVSEKKENSDVDLLKKLVFAWTANRQYEKAQPVLEDLLKRFPNDPYLYERQADWESLKGLDEGNSPTGKILDISLKAIELSVVEKNETNDLFYQLVQGRRTPVSKIRDFVAPCDLDDYLLQMRQIEKSDPDFRQLLADTRDALVYLHEQKTNRELLADFAETYQDSAVFLLEYGYSNEAFEEKDYQTGIACFNRMIDEGKMKTTALCRRGELQMERAKMTNDARLFEKAIADLTQATELAPDWAAAWLKLGQAYAANQKQPLADKAFERGLECEPPHWELMEVSGKSPAVEIPFDAESTYDLYHQAVNMLSEGRTEAAVERLEWLNRHYLPCEQNGDDLINVDFHLGKYYLEREEWQKAAGHLAFMSKVENIYFEENPLTLLLTATSNLGQTGEMATYFKDALESGRSFSEWLNNPELYQAARDIYDAGDADLELIMNMLRPVVSDPMIEPRHDLWENVEFWEFYIEIASHLARQSKTQDFNLINDINRAYNLLIEIDEERYYPYILKQAELNQDIQNHNEAFEAYKRFLKHEPESPEIKEKMLETVKSSNTIGLRQDFFDVLLPEMKTKPDEPSPWKMIAEIAVAGDLNTHLLAQLMEISLDENAKGFYAILESKINICRYSQMWEKAVENLEILCRRDEDFGFLFALLPEETFFEPLPAMNSWNLLARHYFLNQRYDDAVAMATLALEKSPAELQQNISRTLRAEAFVATEKWQEAVEDYLIVCENNTSGTYTPEIAWTVLGNCQMKIKEPLAAGRSFSKALKVDPNNLPAILGRYEAAVEMMKKQEIVDDKERFERFAKLAERDKTILIRSGSIILRFPPWQGEQVNLSNLK